MKKAGKVAIGILATTIVLGGCVVADYMINGSIKDRINGFISKVFDKEKEDENTETKKETEEIKKITDEITEQKSEDNKQEYQELEENKEKSDDVVIPEDAPEDVKEELQQKILYLKVLENIERIYSNSHTPINTSNPENNSSSIAGIKNFTFHYIDDNHWEYVCIADAMNYANGKYYKSTVVMTFITNDVYIKVEDLNNFLSNQSKVNESYVFNESENTKVLAEKIFSDSETYACGNEDWKTIFKIIGCGEIKDKFHTMLYLVEEKHGSHIRYNIMEIDVTPLSKNKTDEEFKDYVMNNESRRPIDVVNTWGSVLGLDWNKTLQEFLDSNVAQASSEQSFETENGFDAVAYYDNVEQQDIQKHVDKQGTNYDFNSNLINEDDFGLSL